MANRYFSDIKGPKFTAPDQSTEESGMPTSAPKISAPERTAAWPGLPGPAQPRARNMGVTKAKIHPTSQGL